MISHTHMIKGVYTTFPGNHGLIIAFVPFDVQLGIICLYRGKHQCFDLFNYPRGIINGRPWLQHEMIGIISGISR